MNFVSSNTDYAPESMAAAYDAFAQAYPNYAGTSQLDDLRHAEYGRLDRQNHVYLDYTGGGLYADSQLAQHLALLQSNVFGNPHSHNPSSLAMTGLVEQARAYVLDYFRTTPDEYVVIFTANASGALKLIGESYPFSPGSHFVLSADDHNSVNGIREFARARGASVLYAPLQMPDLRLDQAELDAILARARPDAHNLFAFPAQSNYSGVKHPLELIERARSQGWDVLLDCAAFAPTNRFDLNRWLPDYATFSFYKIFGYPTGIGALLARRSALERLQRPWFAGGTVKIVSVKACSHFLADDEAGFEDGTINYLSIPAVEIGLRHIAGIGIDMINERVRCLTGWLLDSLTGLQHRNGAPVIHIHGPTDLTMRGGTITMSFFDPDGRPVSGQLVETLAGEAHISLRTGCFCNPGCGETTFNLSKSLMHGFFAREEGMHFSELVQALYEDRGIDISAVRISLGLVSNFDDVYRLMRFVAGFRDRPIASFDAAPAQAVRTTRDAA